MGWYWILDGKAYWHTAESRRDSPCSGRGVGAIGQMLDPVCHLPSRWQWHHNYEFHYFWLVSEDGANFSLLDQSPTGLNEWQRGELMRYATDSTAVFYNSERITGADPATFEVIFPFGADSHWERYAVARDARRLFYDGKEIPAIAFDKVVWLEQSCLGPEYPCTMAKQPYFELGRIDKDILFMQYGSTPTLFKGLAQPDFAYLQNNFGAYCISGGKLFRFQSRLDKEAVLKPMTPEEMTHFRQYGQE